MIYKPSLALQFNFEKFRVKLIFRLVVENRKKNLKKSMCTPTVHNYGAKISLIPIIGFKWTSVCWLCGSSKIIQQKNTLSRWSVKVCTNPNKACPALTCSSRCTFEMNSTGQYQKTKNLNFTWKDWEASIILAGSILYIFGLNFWYTIWQEIRSKRKIWIKFKCRQN